MRADPHPDKGRALMRLEEKQGRRVEKGHRADGAEDGSAESPSDARRGGGATNEPRNII